MSATKRKQKKKQGKVVRLSDYAWSVISDRLEGSARETIDAMIDEYALVTGELAKILNGKTYYAVLSEGRLFSDIEDARGVAILKAVKAKKKQIEEPVRVKVI